MTFERYLELLEQLYYEALRSNVSPELLQDLGGSLAIAGKIKNKVWAEENAYLGLIDRRRPYREAMDVAATHWNRVSGKIEARVRAGVPPAQAVETALREAGTVPHTPEQAQQMSQLVMGQSGTYSRWLYDIVAMRKRIERGNEVMGDTFGAIGAGAYLIAKAKDWQHATPEEWDRAIDAGAVAQGVGNIVGAFVAPKEDAQRLQQTVDNAAAERPRAALIEKRNPTPSLPKSSPTKSSPPKPSRATPPRARATDSRGVSPAARQTASKATQPPQRAPVAPTIVESEANWDRALAESGPFQGSRQKETGRPTHRSGPLAGTKYEGLDSVFEKLTPEQRRAAGRLLSFFPEPLKVAWRAADNARARQDRATVQKLYLGGEQEKAKTLAREMYERYADRFWARVQSTPALKRHFTDAGLIFSGGNNTTPAWPLPDGTSEKVTVDHRDRVQDAPWLATEPLNLQFVTARENSFQLESIRNKDPFQNPPKR